MESRSTFEDRSATGLGAGPDTSAFPRQSSSTPASPDSLGVSTPSISLPKGGGAIQGIGEKFAANPVTGTGSMTLPIYASPGRGGFGPSLNVSYDSGAGNSAFGFGWHLGLPSIKRKTDKGLPTFRDAEESDVFILSGAEDLVPVLSLESGRWMRRPIQRQLDGAFYTVQAYRPRVEGLFARIERWTRVDDLSDTRWRSISKDNVTTWYGTTVESRIADPVDPFRIYAWLVCESYDGKGNFMAYGYKAEDSSGIDLGLASERNRTEISRSANRYPKRILYGNRTPFFADMGASPAPPPPTDFCFEVVFDYGEHDRVQPLPHAEAQPWNSGSTPIRRIGQLSRSAPTDFADAS
jgi:hypothetical protein